jgi:phosphomethylpyrimidine synthase
MNAIEDATDLDASSAAAVNRPPVGTHDTSDVPDEAEDEPVLESD